MLKSTQGTRAASFSAKIRSLQEYHNRLLNGISPLPSSVDIINVLKFFSQALLTILRDIPCLPIDLIRDPTRDSVRINFFPNLDYRTLYHALAQILDSFPYIQSSLAASAHAVFDYTLHAIVVLVPFLEHELMDSMSSTVANTISLNFVSQQGIIDILCYNILPFTLYHDPYRSLDESNRGFANESIPSILMVVLTHTDSLSLHSQLLECLMRLKKDVIEDLLMVIAYGTGKARPAAVEMLFQYWPALNPSVLDRRALTEKHVPWKPLTCQNETCQNSLNNEAVKICFAQTEGSGNISAAGAPAAAAQHQSDCKGRPPIPLLICIECAEMVRTKSSLVKSKCAQDVLLNVLHPMTEISYNCESKTCLSAPAPGAKYSAAAAASIVAVATCFSPECTNFNLNKPIRLCAKCHQSRHQLVDPSQPSTSNSNVATNASKQPTIHQHHPQQRHLVQEHVRSLWQLPLDAQQHFTEAVISLLREASVLEKYSKDSGGGKGHSIAIYVGGGLGGAGGPGGNPFGAGGGGGLGSTSLNAGQSEGGGGGSGATGTGATGGSEAIDSSIEERQLLSRYGIWLLIGLCDPTEASTSERMELLGRMLAMLCQWFHNTACLPDDQAGSALERIKSESIHGWLMKVIDSQFQLFANCLVPSPPDYAQIGGHWESWPSITTQIKEGFKRLLCLVPYDVITADIWAYIMPFWMESFRYDLPEVELAELRILLSKVLDPDLSPLGLQPKQMYHFISICFEHMLPVEQEQALSWLQILTLLEIPVPINLLNSMFMCGIKSFINLREAKEGRQLSEDLGACGDDGNANAQPSTSKLSPGGPRTDNNRSTSVSSSASSANHPALHPAISAASMETIIESQLACFVLMLDILLKQFELQEINAHKGFETKDSANTIKLLYEMISVARCTASVGQVHTCTDYGNTSTDLGTAIPKPTAAAAAAAAAPPARSHMHRSNKPNSYINECFFCELTSVWYQLSLQMITFFAPLVEITVTPDVDLELEFNASSSGGSRAAPAPSAHQGTATPQSSVNVDLQSQSPAAAAQHPASASDDRSILCSIHEDLAEDAANREQSTRATSATVIIAMDRDADSGIGQITSHEFGPAPESDPEADDDMSFVDEDKMLESIELSCTERLTLKFLQELENQTNPDVIYHMLQCLKLLALHAGVLSKMATGGDAQKRKFFLWCQRRYLIGTFWCMLQAEFSQISQVTVPLLLHCVALPAGLSVFTRCIDDDFRAEDWCVRFATIERVGSFAQFVEQSSVKTSHALQSALSSLIMHTVQIMNDTTSAVALRALLMLESMRSASLRLFVLCLEQQFDLVIADRCLVLSVLTQLFNHLGERRVLTWDFFLNRFDTLFLEAQVFFQKSPDCPIEMTEPTRDLRNTNIHSETFKKKIGRVYEAIAQTHLRRSLLERHGRSQKHKESRHNLSFSIFGHHHRATHTAHSSSGSQPGSLTRRGTHAQKGQHNKSKNLSSTSSASSAVNRKSSKLAALTGSAFPTNFFQESGPNKRDIVQEELHLFNIIHRTLDEEYSDNETIHLLVYFFMQFLAWPDAQHPADEKALNRSHLIVLKHVNTLLGYSLSENHFFLSAYDLRRKSIFSAFLSALPHVLDENLSVGALLLPTVFPILVYCPAGHRFVYTTDLDAMTPNYSLWLLQSHLRQSWLSSLIVILYKHDYGTDSTKCKFVHLMMHIVMNTLESALDHRCSPTEALLRRSRDAKDSFNVDGGEIVDSKADSIAEEIGDSATSKGAVTNDQDQPMMMMEDEMMMMQIGLDSAQFVPIDSNRFGADIDAQDSGAIKSSKNLFGSNVPVSTTNNKTTKKSTDSTMTMKSGEIQKDSNDISAAAHQNIANQNTSSRHAATSTTSEDAESICRSLLESFAVDNSPSESSISSFTQAACDRQTGQTQSSRLPPSSLPLTSMAATAVTAAAAAAAAGDDDSGETSETSSHTTTEIASCTPAPCVACVSQTAIATSGVDIPSLERLLPIGGELSESVRQNLARRPPLSMFKPIASTTSSTDCKQRSTSECCCCCCSAATSSSAAATTTTNVPGTSNVCCANFQQTIETFKQQHATAIRELSRERLLPIGPKPVHQQQQHHQQRHQSQPSTLSRSSSRHSRSTSTVAHSASSSRSVEQKKTVDDYHQPLSTSVQRGGSTAKNSSSTAKSCKLLVRQHTTIGTNDSMVTHTGDGHQSVLLPSKSVDSVADNNNYKIRFNHHHHHHHHQQHNNNHHHKFSPTKTTTAAAAAMIVTTSANNNHCSSTTTSIEIYGANNQENDGNATTSTTTTATVILPRPVVACRVKRKSTTGGVGDGSRNLSDSSAQNRSRISSSALTSNGLTDETESEQESCRGNAKTADKSISSGGAGGGSEPLSAIIAGDGSRKAKSAKKKKPRKKSKRVNDKLAKSTPILAGEMDASSNQQQHPLHHHHPHNHKHKHQPQQQQSSQINSPTGTIPAAASNSITSAGGGAADVRATTGADSANGGDSPMATGDNDVFVGSTNGDAANAEHLAGGLGASKKHPQCYNVQSQLDSTKDTASGRSNEASSSTHSDLSTNAYEMCVICGLPIEKFDEQELGLCLISLATFVHRNPTLAAPLLPQILRITSRYAIRRVFPWQMESNVHLPSNTASIARQFIRCTLHQLVSNGIFRQIFQSHQSDVILFRSIAISLADFAELNQVTPLKELFESLLEEKQFPILPNVLHTLSNVANYFECVFIDYNTSQGCNFALSGLSPLVCSLIGASAPNVGASIVANQPWSDLLTPFEAYLRKLSFALSHLAPSIHNLVPLMRVLLALLKIPGIGAHRSILDAVTKILTHIVQHSPLLLEHVRELCILCSRAYVRDRERMCIARTFAVELVQALRFRTHLPDENILLLVQWALEDSGGSLPYSIASASLERAQNKTLGQAGITTELSTTNATEALRMHISELLDFIGDVHALARIKSNFQGTSVHLNEETLGGHLKAGISQFLSLELTRIGGSDHRAITKHLPWLYSLPSLQQGPKEFLECIAHVRLLSWLLLGSLQHTALMRSHPNHTTLLVSQPIPLEASTHIAEHVQAILAGFAHQTEQSKTSVLHMSALFYAFLLCQLWTVYCEQLAGHNPPGSDAAHQNILVLSDFWAKVTPGVLQLICHSKGEGFQQLADTVSLHFLSLMETLMECNSEILARLIPLWLPLFNSYPGQLSGNTRVRLQTIVSWPCPAQTRDDAMMISTILIRWLQRIQTKMSQIEMQSSTAIQFYCI